MIKKIIMFFFMILSLVAILSISKSIDLIIGNFVDNFVNFDSVIKVLKEQTFEEMVVTIGMLSHALLEIYGIPVIIFLVSLNGLTNKKAL